MGTRTIVLAPLAGFLPAGCAQQDGLQFFKSYATASEVPRRRVTIMAVVVMMMMMVMVVARLRESHRPEERD